jgi:hypothetical protein
MPMTEELYMFGERYAHFSNVHTTYSDLLSGHYKPSVNMSEDPENFEITNVGTTAMFMLYAYFYSMVEDDPQGVNGCGSRSPDLGAENEQNDGHRSISFYYRSRVHARAGAEAECCDGQHSGVGGLKRRDAVRSSGR